MNLNGGGHAWLFSEGNTITSHAGNDTRNDYFSNVFAIGANNTISNIGHMRDVYAFGVNNTIRGGRNIGGPSGVSNVFAFGADNDLHNQPNFGDPTLTNAYAFGGGNTMSSAGMLSNIYTFGSNNKIANPSGTSVGNISGGLALGAANTIHARGGSITMNVYAIGAINTIGAASGGGVTNAYAIGTRNSIAASGAAAIGLGNTVSASAVGAYVLGANINASPANNVILGNNSADGDSNPVNAIAIGAKSFVPAAGSAPVGIVSVGAPDGERQIINVASGRGAADSTDAINGAELYITNSLLAEIDADVASLAAGMGASASGASSSAVGAGAKAIGQKSIALGSLSEAHATGGIALGHHAFVVAAAVNSVTIGADSIATDPGTVSFGSETLQRRLVNVADGINPHDAVNMRQLAAFGGVSPGRLDVLQNRMNAVGDRLDRVGAMSAAMNQVQPHLMPDDKNRCSRLALGMGFYRGHGALALGYDYTCRQGDRGARVSFALSDRGGVMGGAGVAFGW